MTDSPLTPPRRDWAMVTDPVADHADAPVARRRWWIAMALVLPPALALPVASFWLFWSGIGVWGLNIPVVWGLDIINTVWWVGIGHAGTVLSALLLLTGNGRRTTLNRLAEAITLFAALMAGLFPIWHLGRPELFYWNFPIPSTTGLWPQFRSPLAWDFFSFLAYVLVSATLFTIGLIPDFATLRDHARRPAVKAVYGVLSLGWRGSAVHWARWRQAYLAIAAAAFHLVLSVHSGVAMLLAGGLLPGWHSTLLPPLFVLGALFSGLALVLMLAVTLRTALRMEPLIEPRHLDIMAKLLLATGLATLYLILAETFHGWYSGTPSRWLGPYAWSAWTALGLNFVPLQLLWFRRARHSPPILFAVALAVVIGMWFERYMLVLTGLSRAYDATIWEWLLLAGTMGVFLLLFLLFIRLVVRH